VKLSHIPLRVATGAFILNSGLSKKELEGPAVGFQKSARARDLRRSAFHAAA
jgi:hypothetical protein